MLLFLASPSAAEEKREGTKSFLTKKKQKEVIMKRKSKHLYRHGAKRRELRSFERKYGRKKGKYVYGATVGKVYRERHRRTRRRRY